MGLITKNIPQMYKIFAEIHLLNPVFSKKFDEMHYNLTNNLTLNSIDIFYATLKICKISIIWSLGVNGLLPKCYIIVTIFINDKGLVFISLIFTIVWFSVWI